MEENLVLITPVDGFIRGPCLVPVCVQLREYYNRTGFSRAIVYDNVVSRPLPLFNPKEKKRTKGTKLCERQLGRIYTHTRGGGEWINNFGSMVKSFEFLLFGRSVGRSGKKNKKQNNNIRMFARKNENNQTGKIEMREREWWGFRLVV